MLHAQPYSVTYGEGLRLETEEFNSGPKPVPDVG